MAADHQRLIAEALLKAEQKLEAVKTWAEKELSENSRIADAKYEEVMEGRDEAPELNYYSGKRDQAKELLKILEASGR